MIAFWWVDVATHSTASVNVGAVTVETDGFAMLIVHLDTGVVAVAESSQKLTSLWLKFILDTGADQPAGWAGGRTKEFYVDLPSGGEEGKAVFVQL